MVYIQEEIVNETEGHQVYNSGVYETAYSEDKIKRLFIALQKEFGKCVSKVYIDKVDDEHILNGESEPIGWYFTKTAYYEDTKEPYQQGAWITLHSALPTKTVEYHYLDRG